MIEPVQVVPVQRQYRNDSSVARLHENDLKRQIKLLQIFIRLDTGQTIRNSLFM